MLPRRSTQSTAVVSLSTGLNPTMQTDR
jgi:hypothetical protein